MEQESIGQKIKRLREAKGLSQERVCELVGKPFTTSHLSRIENEYQNPGYMTVQKILVALGELESSHPRRSHEDALAELEALTPIAIPVVAEGSYGEGDGFVEYAYWAKPKAAGRNIRAILGKGDCLEPDIHSGDIVFADIDLSPEDGNLVICLLEGKIQIKRYRNQDGKVWLENRYGKFTLDECVIQGVVIEQNIKRR